MRRQPEAPRLRVVGLPEEHRPLAVPRRRVRAAQRPQLAAKQQRAVALQRAAALQRVATLPPGAAKLLEAAKPLEATLLPGATLLLAAPEAIPPSIARLPCQPVGQIIAGQIHKAPRAA